MPPLTMSLAMLQNTHLVTDEMRKAALEKSRDVLKNLEDIRKGLELPADQLGLVVEMYGHQLNMLISTEARVRLRANAKKQREYQEKMVTERPSQMGGIVGGGYMPPFYGDPCLDVEDE